MTTPTIGWLPYGSGHSSVLLQVSFLDGDEINTTDLPFTTINAVGTSTHTHDPVKGLLCGANGGYDMIGLTDDPTLDSGGQITCEVESSWLSVDGDTIAATQRICSLVNSGAVGQLLTSKAFTGNFLQTASNDLYQRNGAVDTGTAVNAVHTSTGDGDFVRVNFGWWGGLKGGTLVVAIDGRIIAAGVTAQALANPFDRWLFGGTSGMLGHYVRNFQVSNSPPVFPVTPNLACVVAFGDSLTGTTDLTVAEYQTITSTAYDSEYVYWIERELEKHNLFVGRLYGATYGGHVINQDGTTSSIYDYVNAVLAVKPTTIILGAGSNDVTETGGLSASFEADLKTLITDLMAGDSVQKLYIRDIPSVSAKSDYDTDTYKDYVNDANAIIAAIPAWWDTNNPSNTGAVRKFDVFEDMGGRDANDDLFDSNDVHPNNAGQRVMGRNAARALAKT